MDGHRVAVDADTDQRLHLAGAQHLLEHGTIAGFKDETGVGCENRRRRPYRAMVSATSMSNACGTGSASNEAACR